MPPSIRRRSVSPRNPQRSLVGAVVVALIAGLLALVAPSTAVAAEGSIVDGGFIISDADFFDSDSMTAVQIQTFLNDKGKSCTTTAAPGCLRNYKTNMTARAADAYCKAVPAKANATAAEIIAASALACGISPKVILVMLQKEQGLVTTTAPTQTKYDKAMGQACPDNAACDPAQAGFVNQVYRGARQLQVYTKTPTKWNYKIGTNTIQWHPDKACGTSTVNIRNQATANLYIYTPYRPNVAALAAGSGIGDACSTYGNRNFYNYYQSWFAGGDSTAKLVSTCTVPTSDVKSATGTATVTTTSTYYARTAPNTACTTGQVAVAKGAKLTVTGVYGSWNRVTVSGKEMWVQVFRRASSSYGTIKVYDADSTVSVNACKAPASVTSASGTVQVRTSTSSLNIRMAPTTACTDGSSTIKPGTAYTLTGKSGDWWRITVSGRDYWAHSDYLVEIVAPVPTISGTAVAGQILTAKAGNWSPTPSSLSYQWKRGGTNVAGATASTYRVTNDDAGKQLTVTVTAKFTGAASVSKTSAAVTAKGYKTTRLAGDDRYATAVSVSKAAFPDGAKTVYLATGADFADALAAAPLAASQGAPLLLARKGGLPEATADELKRLKPTRIVLIGGTGVLDKTTGDRLTALLGSSVQVDRIGGADRYETARKIAAKFGTATTVFIATGVDYADALGAAAIAGAKHVPVVLVKGTSTNMDANTVSLLTSLKAASAVVVGGEGAVSKTVAAQLTSLKLSIARYGGADRYATSAALNKAFFTGGATSVVIATGRDYPDALTGSVLAGVQSSPLSITRPGCAIPELADFLLSAKASGVSLVGGTGVLSSAVARMERC